MTEQARTGLLGGTFNPIHVAHLRAAEEVAEALGLERVVFVPSATPPHKHTAAGDRMAPAEMRLAWVRAATLGNPRFAVDDLEVSRGGISYTVETLRAFGAKLAPERPVFLIGEDALAELDTWKEPEAILALAHVAVMTRPPGRGTRLAEIVPSALAGAFRFGADGTGATHRTAGTWMRLLPVTPLDVSASDLRRRLRSGLSVRYLLPETVREEILQSGIYTGGAEASGRRP